MMIINDHGDGYGGDDKDHYSDGIGWRTKHGGHMRTWCW